MKQVQCSQKLVDQKEKLDVQSTKKEQSMKKLESLSRLPIYQ